MTLISADDAAPVDQAIIDDAIAWRRRLHRAPELAFAETMTSEFVATLLEQFGYSVHRGLGGTGVVGVLSRGTQKRSIAIRADMDALPIEERSGVEHESSIRGVMHACGHDGHTAIALAAARACVSLQGLEGTLRFIFQPAEEGAGGARRMVDDGLFKLFPCDAIYSLHNQPAIPFGSCVARDGVMLSASGMFEVVISGKGCHGGRPHQGTDALLAACQLVSAFQSIVSRNIDPLQAAVLSVTQINAGDAFNVIPDHCVIRGTTRWLDEKSGDVLEQRFREIASAIAKAFNCEAAIDYQRKFPATINDPGAARLVRRAAGSVAGLSVLDHLPSTGSEDFSEMLKCVPGCYLWLGAGRSSEDPGLHSPRYDFNDDLVRLGADLWVAVVREHLCKA